jgi:hypothetical protein
MGISIYQPTTVPYHYVWPPLNGILRSVFSMHVIEHGRYRFSLILLPSTFFVVALKKAVITVPFGMLLPTTPARASLLPS